MGLAVSSRVASVVMELVAPKSGDVVLELGAGTGEIGAHLADGGGRYVGLDASANMLRVGRDRTARGLLLAADCDGCWPICDGVVACVFASRVAHLLDVEHVVREVLRVGGDDVWWITGRTRRDPKGFREELRERMRLALRDRGYQPRGGRTAAERFAEAMQVAGGVAIGAVEVASWVHRGTASAVIEGWRDKQSLGGVRVDASVRDAILDEVAGWARERFGGLDAPLESNEGYVLNLVRFQRQ